MKSGMVGLGLCIEKGESFLELLFEVIKNFEKKQNSGKEHEYLEKINGVYQVAE